MIKIRIQTTASEMNKAVEIIRQNFNVIEISAPYANRGNSQYVRVYLDAILNGGDV